MELLALAFGALSQSLQLWPQHEEEPIGQFEHYQHTRHLRQTCQPAPSRQPGPHRYEGCGAIKPGSVTALYMKAGKQPCTISCERGVNLLTGYICKAQPTGWRLLRKPAQMGDLAPAQRAGAVIEHGESIV